MESNAQSETDIIILDFHKLNFEKDRTFFGYFIFPTNISHQYTKLLNENITNAYRKTNKNSVNKINKDAKKIAKSLSIDDRVEKMQKSLTYITVKDHKDNFPHSISCRLINPSKTDIGKISKTILDKINI